MKVVVVVGARPNFMKAAPLLEAFNEARRYRPSLQVILVHTGQHYDERMSGAFFDDLGLPRPDVDLCVGSGSHGEQTGKVLIAFERFLIREHPDWVVVVGDVNSTVACTLAAKKLLIKVAHVEAGLRSGDRTMPEELNRIVTDVLADALFTTEPAAGHNLAREGIPSERVYFVGNVMIDTLLRFRERAVALREWERLGLAPGKYAVLTLHRPSNVDQPRALCGIMHALEKIQDTLPLVFPIHPRTRKMAHEFGLWQRMERWRNAHLLEPLPFLEMLSLTSKSTLILTDSGGLQDEALILGVPCITLRDNTERPITVALGANQIVGNRPEAIIAAVRASLAQRPGPLRVPEKWDGAAARRIVEILLG